MTTSPDVSPVPRWTVGDRLRKARETTGLGRDEFAKAIGISRNSITKYEAGDELPRLIVLNAWVLRTGVSARWIKTGEADLLGPNGPAGAGAESRCSFSPQPGLSHLRVAQVLQLPFETAA